MAITRSPRLIDWMSWKICPLSEIAPKGQFTRHMPQETHLSWSMVARPCSSLPMAFMPQALAQGRSSLRIAP